MTDIALVELPDGSFDMQMDGADLLADDGLYTPIVLSLFSDARANADDALPDPADPNLRGWFADSYPQAPGDRWGSKLWLLGKAKQLQGSLDDAQDYEAAALQWIQDDGWATAIAVTATNDQGALSLQAAIAVPAQDIPILFAFGNA